MGKEAHLPNCLWMGYVCSRKGNEQIVIQFHGLLTTDQAPEQWQKALTSALSVAALSVIDGTAIFHATWIHMGTGWSRPSAKDVGVPHKTGHRPTLKCQIMIWCSDTVKWTTSHTSWYGRCPIIYSVLVLYLSQLVQTVRAVHTTVHAVIYGVMFARYVTISKWIAIDIRHPNYHLKCYF